MNGVRRVSSGFVFKGRGTSEFYFLFISFISLYFWKQPMINIATTRFTFVVFTAIKFPHNIRSIDRLYITW